MTRLTCLKGLTWLTDLADLSILTDLSKGIESGLGKLGVDLLVGRPVEPAEEGPLGDAVQQRPEHRVAEPVVV